jgi:hypothetical protein
MDGENPVEVLSGLNSHLKQLTLDFSSTTLVEPKITKTIPSEFYLSDAFPNPFNPVTRFLLAVPKEQHVKVELYNVLGKRVQMLYDGVLEKNIQHPFVIDGRRLSSGIYLLQVTGQHFRANKRTLLIK